MHEQLRGVEAKTSPELTPEDISQAERELRQLFLDITSDNPSQNYQGVRNPSHRLAEDNTKAEYFSFSLPDRKYLGGNNGVDRASFSITHASAYDSKTNKWRPVIEVQFSRSTQKEGVFDEGDDSSTDESGTRLATITFQIENPTRLKRFMWRAFNREKLQPRLLRAGLTFSGTATVYIDSNTPRYNGLELKDKTALFAEIENLRRDALGQA